MVNCIYSNASNAGLLKTKYFEFQTDFRDGIVIETSNSNVSMGIDAKPGVHTIRFHGVWDVAELYRRHRLICERLAISERRLRFIEEFDSDVDKFLQECVFGEFPERMVALGNYRRVSDGYRPTIKGAFVIVWNLSWPWKQIRKWKHRREAKRWLQEIGEE